MGTKLLFAEADEALRWIYERQFTGLGFYVDTAADGLECYFKIRTGKPAALILDIELPWVDPVWACLQSESHAVTLPPIIITGDDSSAVLSKRFGIPVEQCFQKPFQFKSLVERIETVTAPGQLRQVSTILDLINAKPRTDSESQST